MFNFIKLNITYTLKVHDSFDNHLQAITNVYFDNGKYYIYTESS